MDTRAARGLISGIVLGVIGAVLYYAVTADVSGVDLDSVGVILMVAGAILAAFGLISALTAGITGDSVHRVERESGPAGTMQRESETRF